MRSILPEMFLFFVLLALAGVFLMMLIEARLFPRPFAGSLLSLALMPFIVCALISFLRMRQIAAWNAGAVLDLENLSQKIHEACAPFYLGIGTSAAALLVHALLWLRTRRHRA